MGGNGRAYFDFYRMVKEWTARDYGTPGSKAEVVLDTLLSEFAADMVRTRLRERNKLEKGEPLVLLAKEFPICPLDDDFVCKHDSNQPARVDFLLASPAGRKLYLVEMKTAKGSFGVKQLLCMLNARQRPDPITSLFGFYEKVGAGTSQPEKTRMQAEMLLKNAGLWTDSDSAGNPYLAAKERLSRNYDGIELVYLTLGGLSRGRRASYTVEDRSGSFPVSLPAVRRENRCWTVSVGGKDVDIEILRILHDGYSPADSGSRGKWDLTYAVLESLPGPFDCRGKTD